MLQFSRACNKNGDVSIQWEALGGHLMMIGVVLGASNTILEPFCCPSCCPGFCLVFVQRFLDPNTDFPSCVTLFPTTIAIYAMVFVVHLHGFCYGL